MLPLREAAQKSTQFGNATRCSGVPFQASECDGTRCLKIGIVGLARVVLHEAEGAGPVPVSVFDRDGRGLTPRDLAAWPCEFSEDVHGPPFITCRNGTAMKLGITPVSTAATYDSGRPRTGWVLALGLGLKKRAMASNPLSRALSCSDAPHGTLMVPTRRIVLCCLWLRPVAQLFHSLYGSRPRTRNCEPA